MRKLTPEELLRSLDEFADGDLLDEDAKAILAMTPEQVLKELEAAGYTLAELEATEDALLGLFERGTATPAATPVTKPK